MDKNIAIAWLGLSVSPSSVQNSDENPILNNLSGSFLNTSINALMGSSGSGKSTLLKCLNGTRKYQMNESSKIFVRADHKIRKVFIYQDQEERLMTGLTVKQALTYSSKLKNSGETNVDINHKQIVSDLLSALLISDIKDNRLEKCSGGQLKRLCIGLELTSVNKPNILFIDEPTTGLDSNAAEVVIECLKQMSFEYRITTIVSIHQPNNDLFNKFDDIYVLAKGGVCVYSGPPNALKQHLSDCGIICHQNQVPIEVLIKISFDGFKNEKVGYLCDKTQEIMDKEVIPNHHLKPLDNGLKKRTKLFSFKDLWFLLLRLFHRNYISNFQIILLQLLIYALMNISSFLIMTGVRFGDFYGCFRVNTISNMTWIIIKEEESTISYNILFFCFLIIFSTVIQITIFVINYANDMKIFSSEHKNYWYSVGCFFWSKMIVENSMVIIYAIIFINSVLLTSDNLSDEKRIWYFSVVVLLVFMINRSFGAIVGVVFSKNITIAIIASNLFLFSIVLFNECIFKIQKSNIIYEILVDLDYLNYIFKCTIIIIYGLDRCSPGYDSKVLIEYKLENDKTLLHQYIHNLLIYNIVLIILEFIVFLLKTKASINFYKFNFFKFLKFKLFTGPSKVECHQDGLNEELENCDYNSELSIAWVNLSLDIPNSIIKKKTSKILDDISGYFRENTLNAIMGPSGAGKTSLLKCLNGTIIKGISEETNIYVIPSRRLKSCFIVQNICEHLLEGLTVTQTLLYASKLKNSQISVDFDHNQNIEDLMSKLSISDICDNKVENCSGGERKRLVIASELTSYSKPKFLSIDEPTSGLDSNAAENMISLLRLISRKYGMTTIVSIHQPNNDLFHMFDNVYVLANGGVCVYSGPPKVLRQHLINSNISCDENQVPIEVLLKISSKAKSCETIKQLIDISENSMKEVDSIQNMIKVAAIENLNKRFYGKDFYNLLKRTMRYRYLCQWKSFLLFLITYQMTPLIIKSLANPEMTEPDGCLNLNITNNLNQTLEFLRSQYLVKDNLRYHFYLLSFVAIFTAIIHSITFGNDFKVLKNEIKNGWYSVGAYFWSRTLTDFIPDSLSMIIFCCSITYYNNWMINITYYVVFIMVILCSQRIAQISAIICPNNSKLATSIAISIVVMQNLLANNLLPTKKFHYFLQVFSDLSFLKYSSELIILSIYGLNRCSQMQFSLVLYEFGITNQDFWSNLFSLVMICVVLKLITIVLLVIRINHFFKDERQKTTIETDHSFQIPVGKLIF